MDQRGHDREETRRGEGAHGKWREGERKNQKQPFICIFLPSWKSNSCSSKKIQTFP